MYDFVLFIHSINRYVVLILLIVALVRAIRGWLKLQPWVERDRKGALFLTVSLDIQFLMGLILYFTSPITTRALEDFSSAMGTPSVRFFALEHVLYGVLAVIFAHIGSSRARKVPLEVLKHRTAAIFFSLTLIALVLGIPWSRLIPHL